MTKKKGDNGGETTDKLVFKLNSLSNEGKIALISRLINELKQIEAGIASAYQKNELIPIGVFDNNVLGSLEAIVKYMKENGIKFSKIAKVLNRSSKTIWATYHKAGIKMPSHFGSISSKIMIPASVFANREFSVLETVVAFIKDLDYTNHEVGQMLRLDDRTIWTVYDRVKKKRGVKAAK